MERALALTSLLDSLVREKATNFPDEKFAVAISGGGSPEALFNIWSDSYRDLILWERIYLFWVDERAVSPSDPESNYGVAKTKFLDRVPIPSGNIFRIEAENGVVDAAVKYSKLVCTHMPLKDGFPVFDFVILGIGDDGHTASIFPGQNHLFKCGEPYAPSVNPYTGQQRVTMTGVTIENAKRVVFYLRGESKVAILERLKTGDSTVELPASVFLKQFGENSIYYDRK